MGDFWQTLLIACIPSVVTGIATYFIAQKNASAQIKVVKEQNRHDLEKLMQQHKIDIDNLKEAHKLEMEAKEQDHKNKLELQQKEFENALLRQQKEGENAMATETMKGLLGMFGSAINTAMTTPEGQQLLGESIKNSRDSKREG